jgi:AraC family transcriptional regulator
MANDYEARMIRVIDYIHDHPAGDLSLDALADVAAFSRFHFHRMFQAITGETAAQTVRRMRLHRAAVALATGTAPVAKIAVKVGYPNLSSFARAFSDAYGASPAAFRKRGELRPFLKPERLKGVIMYPIEIRTVAEQRLAAIAHKGPYHEINRAFEKLFASLVARGLTGQTGDMVGVFYDDPAAVAAADLRSHAAVQFAGPIEAPLEEISLPAGRHAVLTYTGPYAGLPAAYDQLFQLWLPESGHEPADSPSFETYKNSPMDTAPEALVTEIYLPLA